MKMVRTIQSRLILEAEGDQLNDKKDEYHVIEFGREISFQQ